jgi:hypothetical protein
MLPRVMAVPGLVPGISPMGIRIRQKHRKTSSPVMPGLDPGTPTTAGIHGDHRIKPGDDGERHYVTCKANRLSNPYPDVCWAKPGHDIRRKCGRRSGSRIAGGRQSLVRRM